MSRHRFVKVQPLHTGMRPRRLRRESRGRSDPHRARRRPERAVRGGRLHAAAQRGGKRRCRARPDLARGRGRPRARRTTGVHRPISQRRTRSARCLQRRTSRRRRRRTFGERRALDLARLVDLEDVAFLLVVEVLEQDAALEALLHLPRVVLEALQLRDRRLVDQQCRRARRAPARRGARRRSSPCSGDRAEPRDAEQLAHLGFADRRLGADRGQHADERALDVLVSW